MSAARRIKNAPQWWQTGRLLRLLSALTCGIELMPKQINVSASQGTASPSCARAHSNLTCPKLTTVVLEWKWLELRKAHFRNPGLEERRAAVTGISDSQAVEGSEIDFAMVPNEPLLTGLHRSRFRSGGSLANMSWRAASTRAICFA